MGPPAAGDATSLSAKQKSQAAALLTAARLNGEATLASVLKDNSINVDDGDGDPRIKAMRQAVLPSHGTSAGQEDADWEDVAQYIRGVGGNALRFMGLPQKDVRNLGFV